MEKFIVDGGGSLSGKVEISGAKNSVLPIMAAAILSDQSVCLKNVPDLVDVDTMVRLLCQMGAEVTLDDQSNYIINASVLKTYKATYELVKTMRASFLVLGPVLAKYGKAEVSLPGGCAIGARPVDLHIKGLELMGAKVRVESGYVQAIAPDGLKGAEIFLEIISVGATENLIMAAVLAEGITIIHNAAREPEIVDLAEFLNSMGAKIIGAGTSTIEVKGVAELSGVTHSIIGDRIEAATFLIAAAASRGQVDVTGFNPDHLSILLDKLRLAGAVLTIGEKSVQLSMGSNEIKPVDIETDVYPGFPTDMQAQFMVLNCIADGRSVVRERIFENRFLHVQELSRLGAKIELRGHSTAVITGVDRLNSAQVMATDLRASSSLVLAALIAEGQSVIDRIYHIDRGYQSIEEKIENLGGRIKRVIR